MGRGWVGEGESQRGKDEVRAGGAVSGRVGRGWVWANCCSVGRVRWGHVGCVGRVGGGWVAGWEGG